ncbi:NUDIX hydrolase [Anoxybacteroides tepidamans]|nr:CoA pyrophosphatase [Anoxybacillus tepidamans]
MDMEQIIQKLQHRTPSPIGMNEFVKYAVLLPLIEKNDEIHILFEVRSFQLRRQPGEICFPGGKVDACDRNEQEAAIRETCEELGVEKSSISNVFPLDYLISPFGMIVYPFVASLSRSHLIKPNHEEVAEIFTVPLSFFQQTQPEVYHVHFQAQPEPNFPFDKIPDGKNYRWRPRQIEEYFYYYEDKVIWGLTAKIVHHFIDVIRSE